MKERIEAILAEVQGLKDNAAVLADADLLTFLVSLLPIPGIQQAGQIANRILSDQVLSAKLQDLRDQIGSTNERIASIEGSLERIGAYALTADTVTGIQTKVEELVAAITTDLEREPTEFNMETSDQSLQVLISQIVEADLVSISAVRGSRNVLKDTKVKAKRTHLRAHDGSVNILDGTKVGDESGSVGFEGISQEGNVSVGPNSIGFHGSGGSISFGRRAPTVTATCPSCSGKITVEPNSLVGKTHVKCPHCAAIHPFQSP
jgi:hypothetical protein